MSWGMTLRASTDGRPAAGPDTPLWAAAIERAISGASVPAIVHQPIVDLVRGTVTGYEALARFAGPPEAGPDTWFAHAAVQGRLAEFEAAILVRSIGGLAALPPNTFLTINVTPALLGSSALDDMLAPFGRLDRLVIEVTEQMPIDDYGRVREAIGRLRDAGALFAVDDAGAGYASMRHVLAVRPDFVKLDRQHVAGCDGDPARVALIEAVGNLASRLDASMIAEGVERAEELDCLTRLGVPLAQGFLLGRPQAGFTPPASAAREVGRAQQRKSDADSLVSLVEAGVWTTFADGHLIDADVLEDDSTLPPLVLDAHEHPARWDGVEDEIARPLIAKASTPIRHIARRAMTRPPESRFLPIVCTDDAGCYVGLVRIERLVDRLAD